MRSIELALSWQCVAPKCNCFLCKGEAGCLQATISLLKKHHVRFWPAETRSRWAFFFDRRATTKNAARPRWGLSLSRGKHHRQFLHLKLCSVVRVGILGWTLRSMPKSVLVVDDNTVIRRVLCQVFTAEEDFDVCGQAENGLDAIHKAQTLRPDLIVMDLSMPLMNGIDAARALKTLMPTVPVIMFSEYGDVFSEEEAKSAGVSALISKSEHVSFLIETARALLYPAAA